MFYKKPRDKIAGRLSRGLPHKSARAARGQIVLHKSLTPLLPRRAQMPFLSAQHLDTAHPSGYIVLNKIHLYLWACTVNPGGRKLDERLELFREVCRRRGLRITPQRTEVFRQVAFTDQHPDADVILRRVRKRVPKISLDTVYRILYRLEDEGLISRVQMSADRLRFDGNVAVHHHFVCSQCGLVRDFQSDGVDRVRLPAEVRAWGAIQGRHLQVRGVCRKCSKSKGERR
ncbi:MAG: transcriptional repressor [Candidatus Brocadiia bacterium]